MSNGKKEYFKMADERFINPDEATMGLRYNEGKPRYSLIHYGSLEPLVRVMEYGAEKYAVDNWKKGMDQREILDSLQRHFVALCDGEDIDKESGVHHIGHIMANAMMYSYYINNK